MCSSESSDSEDIERSVQDFYEAYQIIRISGQLGLSDYY